MLYPLEMCVNWFKRFKNYNFDINDKERSGQWKRNCGKMGKSRGNDGKDFD